MFYRDFCKLSFAIICHYCWEGTPQLVSWLLHPFGLNGCLFSCQVHDVQPPTVGCLAFEATNFVAHKKSTSEMIFSRPWLSRLVVSSRTFANSKMLLSKKIHWKTNGPLNDSNISCCVSWPGVSRMISFAMQQDIGYGEAELVKLHNFATYLSSSLKNLLFIIFINIPIGLYV